MSQEVKASVGLPPQAASAALGRRFISDFCRAAGLDEDLRQTALLLTNELVTNAVQHSGSHARLEARLSMPLLRVAVHDSRPEPPLFRATTDLDAEGGRGLILVAVFADRWGVDVARDDGKAVWFELLTTSSPSP